MVDILTDYLDIENVALTGSEVEYVVPANTTALIIHPTGGDATFARTTGGTAFTINEDVSLGLQVPNLKGKTLFFNSSGVVTVEIIILKGQIA